MSEAAAGLLRSAEPRKSAVLEQFVQLRVIDPENSLAVRRYAAGRL
ncbi:hypothetical protein WJ438_00355 [Streptomyces sp. GD-15H]